MNLQLAELLTAVYSKSHTPLIHTESDRGGMRVFEWAQARVRRRIGVLVLRNALDNFFEEIPVSKYGPFPSEIESPDWGSRCDIVGSPGRIL